MLKSNQLNQIFRLNRDNFTRNIWGGRWLSRWKKIRPTPRGPIGESWEFSSHSKHPSTLSSPSGPSTSLKSGAGTFSRALFGQTESGGAPFLLKFIDAADHLSLQVHPSLAYARRYERESGKSESWLILETKKGKGRGFISLGFRRRRKGGRAKDLKSLFKRRVDEANRMGVERNEHIQTAASRLILPLLNRIKVKPGDVYHVPPGTPHLIGEGVRLFEIQLTSDLTYRVWDWNRPDPEKLKKGIKTFRPLHLTKAFDVLDFHAHSPQFYRGQTRILRRGARGHYQETFLLKEKSNLYALNKIDFELKSSDYEENLNGSFRVLTAMTGQSQLFFKVKGETGFRKSFVLKAGDSALIPATLVAYRIVPVRTPARILKSYVP